MPVLSSVKIPCTAWTVTHAKIEKALCQRQVPGAFKMAKALITFRMKTVRERHMLLFEIFPSRCRAEYGKTGKWTEEEKKGGGNKWIWKVNWILCPTFKKYIPDFRAIPSQPSQASTFPGISRNADPLSFHILLFSFYNRSAYKFSRISSQRAAAFRIAKRIVPRNQCQY